MVVVCVEPEFRFMDRAGICTSTRNIALERWGSTIPPGDPETLVRKLYEAENAVKNEPSGSQDMIGLIYPGINRLDYDFTCHGGYFPQHIKSCNDPVIARWLEQILHVIPVAQRPDGYNPLGTKNLDPEWIRRLGQSGKDCYDAILRGDTAGLGASMNECMLCWGKLLPNVVQHPTIPVDLLGLLHYYQANYPGAMYSGCGGGYLYVVSEETIPGAFQVKVRIAKE